MSEQERSELRSWRDEAERLIEDREYRSQVQTRIREALRKITPDGPGR